MITLKNSELELTLLTISAFDKETGKIVAGLLTENLSLGTKRKLQKIQKAAYKAYTELMEDAKKIKEECKEDETKLQEEIKILLEEEVKIDVEKAQLSQIEAISTQANYNFDVIEKFAE